MANEVAKAENKVSMSSYMTLPKIKNKIIEMVGSIDAPRFMSSVVSAVAANPALAECTQPSIFNAALLGESLKLSPSPQLGQYYMVPYKNNRAGITTAQFQIGYKGYIQLAIRSGQYKKLNVLEIKDGELISWDPLNEEIKVNLITDEKQREETPTIGYYAMFEYSNGFRKALYWSKEKMVSHANKYSQAFSSESYTKRVRQNGKYEVKTIVSYADYEAGNYDPNDKWLYSSFWYQDFDSMAKKTMLRQLISKWGIMSVEMQRGYEADMATINDVSKNTVDATYDDINDIIDDNANQGEEIGFDNDIDATEAKPEQAAPPSQQGEAVVIGEDISDFGSEPAF